MTDDEAAVAAKDGGDMKYPKKAELLQRYKIACDLNQPVHVDKITAAVADNYAALGLKPKKLTMVSSMVDFYNRLNAENIWDSTWSSSLCLGAYEIAQSDRDKVMSIYYPIFLALEAGLWCFAYLEDTFLWLPIPKVKTINGNTLHCETGPAFELPNQKLYYLHGVEVTEKLVVTPAEKLDPALLLKEKNAEVRREIVRKIGIERVMTKLGAETIDKSDGYELLLLDLKDGRKREFLKMRNPSIGVFHIEGVPPGTKTVREALAWRNGVDFAPVALT